MQRNFLAAVAQMTSIANKSENFESCKSLAERAKTAGCSLICFPECHSFIGLGGKREIKEIAEPLSGPTIQKYCNLAQSLSMWFSLGGFQEETTPPSEKVYNSHIIINPQGIIQTIYRKLHLFDVNIEGGPNFTESDNIQRGNDIISVSTNEFGTWGLSICYDLRFPELYQSLRFNLNSDIILIPAAFTKPTGEAHWEILLRARAIETQCYVLAAAQAGIHNERRESFGSAMIIDPWGSIIAKCEDSKEFGIAIAEIDFQKIKKVREGIPLCSHKRNDLFPPPNHIGDLQSPL